MSPQFWPPPGDDSGWITPTLSTGWSTPAGFTPLRWRKINGVVEMQGAASGGSGTTLFTFPVGSRPDILPSTSLYFAGANGAAVAVTRIGVSAEGVVFVVVGATPNFDVVRFRAI